MIIKFNIKGKNSGLTLVESLIGMALLLIVFLGIFGLIQFGMKLIMQSKIRATAIALANQKLELAHNLSYQQVGTTGGIPSGSIPETETITRNKIAYTVKTTVFYIDDPFDGTFPNDSLAWDYKRIKVKVFWAGNFSGELSLQADIAPKGVETTSSGGVISILVFDANGAPVAQANIDVVNNAVSPPIIASYQTDNQGRLFVPGAPACNDCYKISATKFNYSSERTYAVGELVRGISLVKPDKPMLSVINGQLSEISFSIDRVSIKTVQTIKYFEEDTGEIVPIANVGFTMQGAKIIGTDVNQQPVYKYRENLSTNSSGQVVISNLEWDSYKITISSATGYDLANSYLPQPLNVNPNTAPTAILKLANHQTNTLLISVKNSSNQLLIGATVRLYKTGYDKTKPSSDSGQAFFSPLNPGTYNLEIKATGFSDYSGQVDVFGQTEQIIIMTLP